MHVRCFLNELVIDNFYSCFVKYPYGLATFYGPVVLGVAVNWILFFFIARVILKASKAKAKKAGFSNFKMRTVSD